MKLLAFQLKKIVGLKPKMYSLLVENNDEHNKAKGVNRNVVGTISHNECKDVLLNNKFIIHSIMNRIQSKDHRMETYEINKYNCIVLIKKYKIMDMMD